MRLDNFVPESVNHQKMNCVEEDEFLDTHIDHTILKGCGKLQKEARRKEEEFRLYCFASEFLNNQKVNCVE